MTKYHDLFPLGYLRQHYPDLRSFLGAYIGAREDEAINDVTLRFTIENPTPPIEKTINDGHSCLNDSNFPWESITNEANIGFENEQETKEWLKHTIDLMEKTFQERINNEKTK